MISVLLEQEIQQLIQHHAQLKKQQDLTEIIRLISDVRKDIPEIPEIKYYDSELEINIRTNKRNTRSQIL